MIILDEAGSTLKSEASAASSLTVTAYGIETASEVTSYKKLGQAQLTGAGTQDTVYTVPASTVTVCSVIVVSNANASARTLKLWHIASGGSPGDSNALINTLSIPGNGILVWNRGNVTILPESVSVAEVNLSATGVIYLGDADTNGTWRMVRSGSNLNFELRESGSYVRKFGMTP